MPHVPSYTRRAKKKRTLSRLSGNVDFTGKLPKKAAPKKGDVGPPPRGEKPAGTSAKAEFSSDLAKGLATASAAMTGRGKAGRIAKGALAGASAGASIDSAYQTYKDKRKRARAKKATTTVSQAASAQKSQYHKKEHGKTEKH